MINPHYFLDENLKMSFKIYLENHKVNHASVLLKNIPKFPDIGTEIRYFNKISHELATIYARLINQNKYKYHILFSASFYMNNEGDQRKDETDPFKNLTLNHNLTESYIDNIDVKSQLQQQIQIQETKESVWISDKNNSMKIKFYKTCESDGSSYVENPTTSNALLYIKNNDKFCLIGSFLASLHPCENDQPNRFSNYIQYLNELNIDVFDFINGFKCTDVHNLEKIKDLSINIFHLNFYQDKNKWKQHLIHIEISKNETDKNVDLII